MPLRRTLRTGWGVGLVSCDSEARLGRVEGLARSPAGYSSVIGEKVAASGSCGSCGCGCGVGAVVSRLSPLVEIVSPSRHDPALSFCCKLARLVDRLLKLLVMLPLNLRIIDEADALTGWSLLGRAVIPGNGRTSRVQVSDRRASSRALSAREGAKTGIRLFVVKRDCDLLMREP